MATGYAPIGVKIDATIPDTGTKPSAGMDIQGVVPTAILFPASMTSTTMTFEVSMDNSAFYPLYKDDGSAYSITVVSSKAVALDMTRMAGGWNYIKPVGGSAESGAKAISLIARPV